MLALIDCNSFYCNCERLFRPDLKNRPVVVLSNNDGCIISRTPEAKALGITMGVPYHHVMDLCRKERVGVFSANFALYTNLSSRVMSVLKNNAPKVEIYSVDEAFADLSGIKDPVTHGQKMKSEVERLVGIPVAIGIAPSKTLTKIAAEYAKKNNLGVMGVLTKEQQEKLLANLPVQDVWGVSHGRLARLQSLGIRTAPQFRDYQNRALLRKNLTKLGEQIQDELRGIPCFGFGERTEKKKSIMSSRSFGQAIYDRGLIAQAIATHVSDVAEEMRMQGSVCRKLYIMARSNPFQENQPQYQGAFDITLHTPTSHTLVLIEHALELLNRIWKPGIPFHKVGVMALDLQDANEHVLDLFAPLPDPRGDALMMALDQINYKQGPRTLRSLACGTDGKAWAMRRNMLSPRYTTSWKDLPIVS